MSHLDGLLKSGDAALGALFGVAAEWAKSGRAAEPKTHGSAVLDAVATRAEPAQWAGAPGLLNCLAGSVWAAQAVAARGI